MQVPAAKSGFFIILAYGLAAAGIFMLQACPLTGMFLMLLAAPLWIAS